MENRLDKYLSGIKPLDREILKKAQERLNSLTKPKGSLGRLEEFGKLFVGIRGDLGERVKKKVVFVYAGDHGVVEEGVSAFPKEVTKQMVYTFLRGGAGINVVARHAGCDVVVIDIGVDGEVEAEGLLKRKIKNGTNNISKGPAMTREEAIKSIMVGIELAEEYVEKGYNLFATGDMGIGNTTPSSAIYAVITGKDVDEVTGKGTGISDEALRRKREVVRRAIEVNKPNPKDPIDVLSKVGGFEIGGIAGTIIGCAYRKMPVVVDGIISTAGALIAVSLNPTIKDYIFCSHRSAAFGHQAALEWLGKEPMLDLKMRLGEGTGAAIGMWLIELGEKILHEMETFEEAKVTEGKEVFQPGS